MIAWVVGASGAWGGAVTRELDARGFDVVALGRTAPADPAAAGATRHVRFLRIDLEDPVGVSAAIAHALDASVPEVLFVCSAAAGADRALLAGANYLAPAALIEQVAAAMGEAGRGRIGVFVGQNARLGLAGAAAFSASQAALWTWCESFQAELAGTGHGITLTRVIPPRTASHTQQWLADRTGRRARLHDPDAHGLTDAVLAGRRTAGRRPILAALAMVLR